MSLTLSLVGRPNVGKSTLFNRLVGRRASLVHDEPGLTRDRIYGDASFDGLEFLLIDTGGIEPDSDSPMMAMIKRQAQVAIDESDAILFLVDAKSGLMPADYDIAELLRRTQKPVYLLVNKTESHHAQAVAGEFYALGFKHVNLVSAAHGQGLDELFEAVARSTPHPDPLPQETVDNVIPGLTRDPEFGMGTGPQLKAGVREPPFSTVSQGEREEEGVLSVAIVGKPNAGKSSFVNKLLGEDRLLVSEQPGTTLDAVDEEITYAGHRFKLIDTAGIRRKRSIYKDSEKMAVSSSLGALDRCQVALMLIDATAGVTEQDLKVASFIDKKGKAVVIVVNKWDLSKGTDLKAEPFILHLREKMSFLAHAPVRFVSALTGSRVFDVLEVALEVAKSYTKRAPTSQVNRMLERAVAAHQPPMVSGRRLKFYYGTQVSVAPPTFLFTVNDKSGIHFSYERYLMNRIREEFEFKGCPIRLVFRERS